MNHHRACWRLFYGSSAAGREYLAGLHDGLGGKASTMIVKEVSYEHTDAGLASQIAALKGSGADVFINLALGKFATQAIRRVYDIGWRRDRTLLISRRVEFSSSGGEMLISRYSIGDLFFCSGKFPRNPRRHHNKIDRTGHFD